MKYKLCILSNEFKEDHLSWIKSIESKSDIVEYSVINLTTNNWLDEVLKSDAQVFIARPPGLSDIFKNLYDERVIIIATVLKKKIYPSLNEILVYENKKFLSYFLKANNIPHPSTNVFYYKDEAVNFCENVKYPIVAKFNIGASGSGVEIIRTKEQAKEYIHKAFSGKGAPKRWGPNLEKGGLIKRGSHYFLHPGDIIKKLKLYAAKKKTKQIGFLILQDFVKHSFEWRCVRIGDSFFAHKKLVVGNKASGTLLKSYEDPPIRIFDFIRGITDTIGFNSIAIDMFETENGDFLVNEMQCYFGQSDAFQMMVKGEIGRYIHIDNNWVFQKGDFAKNACFDLRLTNLLNSLTPVKF